jgi:hypothetical protein
VMPARAPTHPQAEPRPITVLEYQTIEFGDHTQLAVDNRGVVLLLFFKARAVSGLIYWANHVHKRRILRLHVLSYP